MSNFLSGSQKARKGISAGRYAAFFFILIGGIFLRKVQL
ncbi:putative membrane protein [Enterobacter hormaechei]|nr:putative membrane protein [Enterobacter hormaechei]